MISIFYSFNDGNNYRPSNGQSETWDKVPLLTQVPEIGEKNLNKNIAFPVSVLPELKTPEGFEHDSLVRTFEVTISDNKFSPNTIIVYQGDRPRVNFTALDGDYYIRQPDYGLKQTISKGETGLMSFRAEAPGKFTFYCESCGGPEKGPIGYIIIKENG